MNRPQWLDPCISFCQDTPEQHKKDRLVHLDIHQRSSQKTWKWGVEVDFIDCPAKASSGAWAQIDDIASCCNGERFGRHSSAGSRSNYVQFNFSTAKGAFRFSQQTLTFVRLMHQSEIGLVLPGKSDPLQDLFMKAQSGFFDAQRESQLRRLANG